MTEGLFDDYLPSDDEGTDLHETLTTTLSPWIRHEVMLTGLPAASATVPAFPEVTTALFADTAMVTTTIAPATIFFNTLIFFTTNLQTLVRSCLYYGISEVIKCLRICRVKRTLDS